MKAFVPIGSPWRADRPGGSAFDRFSAWGACKGRCRRSDIAGVAWLAGCDAASSAGYSPTRGIFRRHAENPLAADVVIVDEVSMVGDVLMAQLLQAVGPQCKLILLGDKDQLPSVEAGAVLAGLVPSGPPNRFRPAVWERLHALFPDMSLEDAGDDWPDHVAVLQVQSSFPGRHSRCRRCHQSPG